MDGQEKSQEAMSGALRAAIGWKEGNKMDYSKKSLWDIWSDTGRDALCPACGLRHGQHRRDCSIYGEREATMVAVGMVKTGYVTITRKPDSLGIISIVSYPLKN